MNLEAQLAAADARVAETMAARDEALHLLALAQLVYNEAVATDRNFETALGDRDFAIDGFLTSQFGYHLALGVWSPLYDEVKALKGRVFTDPSIGKFSCGVGQPQKQPRSARKQRKQPI
jgi:hypothetical protein